MNGLLYFAMKYAHDNIFLEVVGFNTRRVELI